MRKGVADVYFSESSDGVTIVRRGGLALHVDVWLLKHL